MVGYRVPDERPELGSSVTAIAMRDAYMDRQEFESLPLTRRQDRQETLQAFGQSVGGIPWPARAASRSP